MRYIIIAAIIFIFATFIKPELVWQMLIAFAICVAGFVYFNDSDGQQTMIIEHEKNEENSEFAFNALLGALQHPAYIINQRGAIKAINQSSIDTFGNINIGDLITIRFRQPELSSFIERALAAEEPMDTNYSEPFPNGRWFAVNLAPVEVSSEVADPENTLFILAFYDLTEAKRTEQMRSDFIANASHELRTPIASLLGYIETIRGAAKNDKKATDRFLSIMQDQAERMTRLVNDLLSLSRIEMQSHVQPSEIVNITEILKTVTRSLDELAKQMNVKINIDKFENVYVLGDQDGLVQVFENLIENACKYGDEGGRVDISFKKEHAGDLQLITIAVRDYGPGIAIEDQQRITERFYRVDVARSREKQGTGLGLAIVKHILNRHKVRLAVKSNLGEGAEFSVKFPIHTSYEN